MISLLSQNLGNNPYNLSVTPIQKIVNIDVSPAHQVSSQSNTYSIHQQSPQASIIGHSANVIEFHSNMSTQELEHKVMTAAQVNINETTADIQRKKQNIWQLAIQKHYLDSQKSALNAYVVSATGESVNETSVNLANNVINAGLTYRFMSLIERKLARKNSDISKPESPVYASIPANVYSRRAPDTMSEMVNQQMINQYNSVQQQGLSTLLHLSV